MKPLILPIAFAFTVLAGVVEAEEKPSTLQSDYARINAALVEDHVLPRYRQLAEKTGELAAAAGGYCREGRTADTKRLRDAFHDAMQAYLGIQHLRFGPVEYFSRAQRFHFWPQARGKIARAIETALGLDHDALVPDRFERSSAAVQGFPAAELLIFDDRYLDQQNGCRLLLAVTANLRRMAVGIVADWTEGKTPFVRTVMEPGPDNGVFRDHGEVTLELFKSLHGGLQFIVDVRLRPVIGESLEKARPVLAESRPSGRSTHNVVDSLQAAHAIYLGAGGPGFAELTARVDPRLDRLMKKAFRVTLGTARSVDHPLETTATNPALRPRVSKLLLQSRALQQIVRDRLSRALGFPVGFNSLDGD